jgi:hypothetical protein
VEQERDRIGELVDRIYRDDAFRGAVEQDPTVQLAEWGIPEAAIGSVLVLAGAPNDVVERATADVEAHLLGGKPATIAALAATLGALAFAQQASAGVQPAKASSQVAPAAQVQLSPAAQAQVSSAAQARVSSAAKPQVASTAAKPQVSSAAAKAQVSSAAAKAQVARAAQQRWQGVQAKRLQTQALALLRSQGRGF